MRFIEYLKGRLGERSTWAGIVAAIIGGNGLSQPWATMAVIAGVVAALVPDAPKAA